MLEPQELPSSRDHPSPCLSICPGAERSLSCWHETPPSPALGGGDQQTALPILELLYPRRSASSGFIKRKASKRVVFLGTKMELVEGHFRFWLRTLAFEETQWHQVPNPPENRGLMSAEQRFC